MTPVPTVSLLREGSKSKRTVAGSSPREGGSSLLRTEALLSRTRAGDEAARAELLDRYRPYLERFLHARLPAAARGLHDTHDLVQDTLLRALESLPRFEYRGVGSFWGFLRAIARNHLIEVSRRAAHPARGSPLPEDGVEARPARDPDPSTVVLRGEQIEAFEAALSTLPEKHREALLMRIELGVDYASIAAECGFPSADAARMAVTRATVRVAGEMGRSGLGGT
ncbi:MAG TPA: sigma-70 family RNA polymerase sigma factor [Planctomycetota bacterium]|nr:sigma-70 family RNA polymerase sigma factor [Planctomycetota bacterium]